MEDEEAKIIAARIIAQELEKALNEASPEYAKISKEKEDLDRAGHFIQAAEIALENFRKEISRPTAGFFKKYFLKRRYKEIERFVEFWKNHKLWDYRFIRVCLSSEVILQKKYGDKYEQKKAEWILENAATMTSWSMEKLVKQLIDKLPNDENETGRDDFNLFWHVAFYASFLKWSEKVGLFDLFYEWVGEALKMCEEELKSKKP